MSSEQRKSKLKSEFDSFGRDGHRSYFPRPHSTGWFLAILTAISLLTCLTLNVHSQVIAPKPGAGGFPPVPGGRAPALSQSKGQALFNPQLSAAAILPPPTITNQIDWQFLPIDPATALSLSNGLTAFIEVRTNFSPDGQSMLWTRIAAAPYPPEGGWLHSAFISRPNTFYRTRAGYYLNNPTN